MENETIAHGFHIDGERLESDKNPALKSVWQLASRRDSRGSQLLMRRVTIEARHDEETRIKKVKKREKKKNRGKYINYTESEKTTDTKRRWKRQETCRDRLEQKWWNGARPRRFKRAWQTRGKARLYSVALYSDMCICYISGCIDCLYIYIYIRSVQRGMRWKRDVEFFSWL